MDLGFNIPLARGYNSASQIARILTEDWVSRNMYCPICGSDYLIHAETNAIVKDYMCEKCSAQYELKSKKTTTDKYQSKVPDGVYRTMIERINSLDNPNFFFMHYENYRVNNLIVVPKFFFTPHYIERRAPLKASARRSGWEGCNILLGEIPQNAKIFIVKNGVITPKEDVVQEYEKVSMLKTNNIENRGWLYDVVRCIEHLGDIFTLKQLYTFVLELEIKHPNNHNIEAKIRQQLQILRDMRFIKFAGKGVYTKIK